MLALRTAKYVPNIIGPISYGGGKVLTIDADRFDASKKRLVLFAHCSA